MIHKKFKPKILIVFLMLMASLFLTIQTTYAATHYDDIVSEVETYVSEGKLESWHNNYSWESGYQTFYTKVFKLGMFEDPLDTWSSYNEDQLLAITSMYRNKVDTVWNDLVHNLDIEPYNLEANKILGLYWDSNLSKHYSYLYLVWTTEYQPTEFITLKEVTINGTLYKQYETEKDKEDYTPTWEDSDYLHYGTSNLTIHKTAIAGFYNGKQFGVPLTPKYHIQGFTAGVDEVLFFNNPDPTGKYTTTSIDEVTFDLGLVPKEDGKKAFQIVTHAYEIIQDVEVQSHFDLGFGGFKHHAVFNTTISIDKIYRVDVSYTLSSENKKWYEFYLNTKEQDVKKSLTAKRISSGIFNLFEYQGFKEGTFKSNVKDSKTYQYQLHLNYDDDAWNLFEFKSYYEADYKVIKNFKILRINYIVDEKVYDVAVKMDTVDGETLGILDRDLILDTDSSTWKVKESIYDVFDEVSEKLSTATDTIYTIGAVIIGLILLYIIYKIIKFINYIFKTKGKE
ncbi:MAG: hypothetical protein KKH92_06025 [Firmicutes bacterium]|nr:hypothetical protein [Bacillota bacterium]